MLSAIVGVNWGDEGKGRIVDYLSQDFDIVSRYQGGNNAGHTVVNEKGTFILNLLPSGILRDGTVNVMGTGMVIDIEHLVGEIGRLREKGIEISPENLKISDRATICMPYHRIQDCLEEDRLSDKKFGSTRRGIAPVACFAGHDHMNNYSAEYHGIRFSYGLSCDHNIYVCLLYTSDAADE